MHLLRSLFNSAIPVLFGSVALIGCTGCDDPTPPGSNQINLGLNIFLFNHPQEADINENVYLAGRLIDAQGDTLSEARVTFRMEPDTLGEMTPFANTNPDSVTGFNTRVTFIGRRPGIVLITGQVLEGENILGRDTVSIRVRDPING